jgi:hypothetical protein
VELHPVQLVSSTGIGRTGLQLLAGSAFEGLEEAPRDGYDTEETLTVQPGELVVVRAENAICAGQLRSEIFSKLVVDSVNVANRTIHFRMAVDPNCGFRSFREGIPED